MPVMGIVYAPALDRLFWCAGIGLRLKCSVISAAKLKYVSRLQAVGLRSLARLIEIKLPMIGCKPRVLATLLRLGHLKFCLIAAGEADAIRVMVQQWSGIQRRQMLLASCGWACFNREWTSAWLW